MNKCLCCHQNESLKYECPKSGDYLPLTTHLQGMLYSNAGEPMPNAIITSEATDRDDSYEGHRTTVKTDQYGRYNFKLRLGWYKVYIAENEDSSERLIGKVHVCRHDYDSVYSIEQLLNK